MTVLFAWRQGFLFSGTFGGWGTFGLYMFSRYHFKQQCTRCTIIRCYSLVACIIERLTLFGHPYILALSCVYFTITFCFTIPLGYCSVMCILHY